MGPSSRALPKHSADVFHSRSDLERPVASRKLARSLPQVSVFSTCNFIRSSAINDYLCQLASLNAKWGIIHSKKDNRLLDNKNSIQASEKAVLVVGVVTSRRKNRHSEYSLDELAFSGGDCRSDNLWLSLSPKIQPIPTARPLSARASWRK